MDAPAKVLFEKGDWKVIKVSGIVIPVHYHGPDHDDWWGLSIQTDSECQHCDYCQEVAPLLVIRMAETVS